MMDPPRPHYLLEPRTPSTSVLQPIHSPPHHTQTPLPSIRQLHPHLPPSNVSRLLISPEGSTYNAQMLYHPVATGSTVQGVFGEAESSPEADSEHAEHKKRRRRQALSCVECKRRKIKCDRTQPCAPCTRRGEQHKCQWLNVEPIEKYVTRAEYDDLKSHFDELKGRFEILERFVSRMFSGTVETVGIPDWSASVDPGTSIQQPTEPNTPYPASPTRPLIFPPMMASSPYPHQSEASRSIHRYFKSDSISSSRHRHSYSSPEIIIPPQPASSSSALSYAGHNSYSKSPPTSTTAKT